MLRSIMLFQFIGLALVASAAPVAANEASATCAIPNIYVASYAGGVHTLQYTEGDNKIKNVSTTYECGPADKPASPIIWLEIDKANNLMYCSEEAAGLVTSLQTSPEGKLTKLGQADVAYAPVSTILFNEGDNRAIAVANYAKGEGDKNGPGLTVLAAPKDGKLDKVIQYIDLSGEPGSVKLPEQATSHPHQVVLDPTGKFIIVPDLGSDMVRSYAIDLSNNNLKALDPVKSIEGSGPRHGIFWSPDGPLSSYESGKPLFFNLIHEFANTIITYSVSYPEEGKIVLEQVSDTNSFGGAPPPSTALASELQVSHDNKFVYAANRLDNSFTVPADFGNDTQVPSDSFAVFSPQPNGQLAFVQLAAAGGVNPRHFSLNKRGDLLLAGFNTVGVVLLKRDPASGKLGEPVARLNEAISITTSFFDE